MNQRYKVAVIFIIMPFLISIKISATNQQTGSATAISSQASSVQYLTTTNNAILFGAVMTAGFSFGAAPASATWNSCFPAYGAISMNGGTLNLARDLYLGPNAVLNNGGTFTCNGFSVVFPHDTTSFSIGTSPSTFNSGNVTFNSPISLSTTLIFQGTSLLNGGGNVITLADTGGIIVRTGGNLTITNATLQGVAGSQLGCQDNTGSLTLQNVKLIQDATYTFTLGTLNISNDVLITGSSIFSFRSTNSLNINSFSKLIFDPGTTFNYDTTNASLLKFSDETAQLNLNSATLSATGTGINITKGTMNIDGVSFFSSTGTLGITIGSCVAANDCVINMFNNAQLTVLQGPFNFKNVNAASFNMFNNQVIISCASGATLNVYKSLNGLGMIIFQNNSTLGVAVGATLGIDSLQQGVIVSTLLPAC